MAFPALSGPVAAAGFAIATALAGASAVVVGALSAHGGVGYAPLVDIGLAYHMPHAVAAAAALFAAHRDAGAGAWLRWAALFWFVGILGFSGGIYLHGFAEISAGKIVPTGGVMMIVGWIVAGLGVWLLARGARQ